jgi:ABC-type branched-subunit amino acid transport system substrate-binding protein
MLSACTGGASTPSAQPSTQPATQTQQTTSQPSTSLPQTSTQTSATASAAAKPNKVLKIGTIVPLNIPVGLEIKKWHELFGKMIKESGGWKIGNDLYEVQFLTYDGGYQDPITTRTAIEKAVYQDKVNIILDCWSADRPTIMTVTEPNKVLVLADGNTDDLVQPSVKYYIRTSGIYFANGFMAYVFQDFLNGGARTGLTITLDNDFGHFGVAQDDATRTGWAYKILSLFLSLEPV